MPEQRLKAVAVWGLVAAFWAGAAAWARSTPAGDDPARSAPAAVSAKPAPSTAPTVSTAPPSVSAAAPEPAEPDDAGTGEQAKERFKGRLAEAEVDDDGGLPLDEEEELLYGGRPPVFDPAFYDDEQWREAKPPVRKERHHYTHFEQCVNFKLMFPEYGDFDCEDGEHEGEP